MEIYKYTCSQILDAKNVKEYEQKANTYIKNYKVTSNKKQKTKKKYTKKRNIQKCVSKIYKNISIM